MKKNIIVRLLLISVLFFSTGCIDEQDLGDNYYYLPKYESIDVGYPDCAAIIYKSDQKYSYSDIKIKRDVIKVNHNGKFIISVQKQTRPCIDNSYNDTIDSLNYYIINKNTDKIYGPYNRKRYIQKRDKLCVPQELEFENNFLTNFFLFLFQK